MFDPPGVVRRIGPAVDLAAGAIPDIEGTPPPKN
jgi:hypothetical protein